jgi:hypothetical protein
MRGLAFDFFTARGASILEFAGDKVRRHSGYWDMATFLRQRGLMLS